MYGIIYNKSDQKRVFKKEYINDETRTFTCILIASFVSRPKIDAMFAYFNAALNRNNKRAYVAILFENPF